MEGVGKKKRGVHDRRKRLHRLMVGEASPLQRQLHDPCGAKSAHLKALQGATENLHLFKADLLDYTCMVSAIAPIVRMSSMSRSLSSPTIRPTPRQITQKKKLPQYTRLPALRALGEG